MKDEYFAREERKAADEGAGVSSQVSERCFSEDKEYMECVRDIMTDPVFRSMDDFLQHGDTTCMEHCIKVSYLTYCICRKWDLNWEEAARAALLHDLFLYDWHTHAKVTGEHFHGFTHPKAALLNAERYFSLTEREKDMILRHMWPLTPIPPRSREGMALICADKFCGLTETAGRIKRWVLYGLGMERTA